MAFKQKPKIGKHLTIPSWKTKTAQIENKKHLQQIKTCFGALMCVKLKENLHMDHSEQTKCGIT